VTVFRPKKPPWSPAPTVELGHNRSDRAPPDRNALYNSRVRRGTSLAMPDETQGGEMAVSARSGVVLVVDDVAANRDLLTLTLQRDGHIVETASSGEEALASIVRRAPDVLLLDVMMPGMDGFEVCRRLKNDPATHLIPVVLVTALHGQEDKLKGIEASADDFLSKPVNAYELRARVRALLRLKRRTAELESADAVITSLAVTIEARDPYTDGHCQRLARYAVALAVHLNLLEEDLAALHRGGTLHDLGKVSVSDTILLKPGPLTPEEYELMKLHTVVGDLVCGNLQSLRLVRPIVRHHHERLDGTGYPDGLRGEAIPLLAQIMSLVDVYDALTTDRPYRAALSQQQAYEELSAEAGRGWRDRTLVDEFIALSREARLDQLAETGLGIIRLRQP
jgi:putative two-component system response regulator